MEKKKITWNNIKSFLEGYKNFFLLKVGAQPDHIKEQVAYRMSICVNDCMVNKECKYCGCSVPAKMLVKESCNGGERFPNLMNEQDWDKYKLENGIK